MIGLTGLEPGAARMKANEIYFDRTRGSWEWVVDFEISNYSILWQSNLTLLMNPADLPCLKTRIGFLFQDLGNL